ncbi:hypothetical protein ANFP_12050 [Acidithiobacillus ferrooxidans]|nr:hypothetical protein ANFP_12050 [Acidithiobacillus ferrooxidans]
MNAQMPFIGAFHLHPHAAKSGDGGQHIGALQQPLHFSDTFSKRPENDRTVGNGFVSRDRETAGKPTAWTNEISSHDSVG